MTPLLKLEHALVRTVARDLRRREERVARERALRRFARLHASWHASLFDAAFLARLPEDLHGRDATAIARAWTQQFRYRDERRRERDVRRLEPVVGSFLHLLAEAEAELRAGAPSVPVPEYA